MLHKTITLLILASFSKWRDKVSVGENKENTARLFFFFFFFSCLTGIGVNLLLINPEKAIKLAVNDQVRQMYGGKR